MMNFMDRRCKFHNKTFPSLFDNVILRDKRKTNLNLTENDKSWEMTLHLYFATNRLMCCFLFEKGRPYWNTSSSSNFSYLVGFIYFWNFKFQKL